MGLTSLDTNTTVQYEIGFPPISNNSQEIYVQETNPREETLSSLKNKLPRSYLMPPHTLEDGRLWSDELPKNFDTTKPVTQYRAIQVTNGVQQLGVSINENTSFLDYIHSWRKQTHSNQEKLKITVENNVFQHGDSYLKFGDEFSLAFKRTLRLPDDGKEYPLVPDLGTFPIKLVDDYIDTVPPSWRKHGGVFIPMYNFEAMFIQFRSPSQKSYSIQVAVGMVNALNGNKWTDNLEQGGYMISHLQRWIDGINSGNSDGRVKQFIAQGLGKGTTVEAQVTGKETFGGIQIQVAPQKFNKAEIFKKASVIHGNSGILELFKTPKECQLNNGDVIYILSEDMFGKGEPTLEQLGLAKNRVQKLSFQYQQSILFFELPNPQSTRDILTLVVPKNNSFTVSQMKTLLEQKFGNLFQQHFSLRYKSLVLLPEASVSSYNIPDFSIITVDRTVSQPVTTRTSAPAFQFASSFSAGSAKKKSYEQPRGSGFASTTTSAPAPPPAAPLSTNDYSFGASINSSQTPTNAYYEESADEEEIMDDFQLQQSAPQYQNHESSRKEKSIQRDSGLLESIKATRKLASEPSGDSHSINRSRALEMGIGAGGRMVQKVYSDPNYPPQMFDLELSNRCYVHIVNAEMWTQITGEPCPPTPIDPQTYRANGIPWSQIYDSDLEYVKSSNKLNSIQTVQHFCGLQEGTLIRDGDWNNNQAEQVNFPKASTTTGGMYIVSEDNCSITLNENEKQSFDRIMAMGFDKRAVIEAFVVCEKRENDVVNFLLGSF